MLKPGVLDPAGNAISQALRALGFAEVNQVRLGKTMEIELEGDSTADIRSRVEGMCRKLLANPVTEDFRFEIEGAL
jgi:phosphoribosylformylglycinamidine synthase